MKDYIYTHRLLPTKNRRVGRIARALGFSLLLPIIITMGMADDDVSREVSWTAAKAPFASNSHGSTTKPSSKAWSYHHQPGSTDSGLGINALEPSQWTVIPFVGGPGGLFRLPAPEGADRGRAEATPSALATYWNTVEGQSPSLPFMPSWTIATYTESGESGGVYDISGKLSWALRRAVPSGDIRIIIAKISGDTASVLFETSVNSTSEGIFPIFDSNSGQLTSELSGISLKKGESIAFGIRGSDEKYREVILDDSELHLLRKP